MDSAAFEIGGRLYKACPGWAGNGFSCRRSRIIDVGEALCEACSRGVRNAAQRERQREGSER